MVPIDDVLMADGNLSIARYVKKLKPATVDGDETTLASAWAAFDEGGREFWTQLDALVDMLDGVVAEEVGDA